MGDSWILPKLVKLGRQKLSMGRDWHDDSIIAARISVSKASLVVSITQVVLVLIVI